MIFFTSRGGSAHQNLLYEGSRMSTMLGRMGAPEMHFERLDELENVSHKVILGAEYSDGRPPVKLRISRMNMSRHAPYTIVGLLFISSILSANMALWLSQCVDVSFSAPEFLLYCLTFTSILGVCLSQHYHLNPISSMAWTLKDLAKVLCFPNMHGGSFEMCKKDEETMCRQLTTIREVQGKFHQISSALSDTKVPLKMYASPCSFHYNSDCPFCLEPMHKQRCVVSLSCRHAFHASCLANGMAMCLSFQCPICRQELCTDEVLLSCIVKRFDNTMFTNIKKLEDILRDYFAHMSSLFVDVHWRKKTFTDSELLEPVESMVTFMVVMYSVGCIVMSNMFNLTVKADSGRSFGKEQDIVREMIHGSRFMDMVDGKDSDIFHILFEAFCPGVGLRMKSVRSLAGRGMLNNHNILFYLMGGRMPLVDVRSVFESASL